MWFLGGLCDNIYISLPLLLLPMKAKINHYLQKIGLQVTKVPTDLPLPFDMNKEFTEIFVKSKPYTRTNKEKMYEMYLAARYIVEGKVLGDIVECGVFKGGSAMVGALTLLREKDIERKFYLYDTYRGMPEPTERDIRLKRGHSIRPQWEENQRSGYNAWCYATLPEVKKNMYSTGYPKTNLIFIEGLVEDTIPKMMPDKISLLRLDMDLYEPTKHVLPHLFPRLVRGGVLLLDDYGDFKGEKDAVDEYFRKNNIHMLLHRIDTSGRIGIKT